MGPTPFRLDLEGSAANLAAQSDHPYCLTAPRDRRSPTGLNEGLILVEWKWDHWQNRAIKSRAGHQPDSKNTWKRPQVNTLDMTSYQQAKMPDPALLSRYLPRHLLLKCVVLVVVLVGVIPAAEPGSGAADRAYHVQAMTRIARPVLEALAAGRLKASIPDPEWSKTNKRSAYVVLEATGRTLSGLAPWLALGPDATPEGVQRAEFIALAQKAVISITDPNSPDFADFTSPGQPLVDAAFLAYALVRAPQQLWEPLTAPQRANLVAALIQTRNIKPGRNNWLLFSAMVETALWTLTGEADPKPIETAVNQHMEWYLGDGVYGDGPEFHFDYYNAYVIQPFLLEALAVCKAKGHPLAGLLPKVLARAQRYAEIQERMISPEGTFPVMGRSSVYRFAAFHHLAYVALTRHLPPSLKPGAVRPAITAVVRRMVEAPGTFDAQGWLTPGAVGHQASMRDNYNNSGSFYLCLDGLIALGLPADDPFWTAPAEPWTQQRIWAGEDVGNDHYLSNRAAPH